MASLIVDSQITCLIDATGIGSIGWLSRAFPLSLVGGCRRAHFVGGFLSSSLVSVLMEK